VIFRFFELLFSIQMKLQQLRCLSSTASCARWQAAAEDGAKEKGIALDRERAGTNTVLSTWIIAKMVLDAMELSQKIARMSASWHGFCRDGDKAKSCPLLVILDFDRTITSADRCKEAATN
jgi:hypothetical protein